MNETLDKPIFKDAVFHVFHHKASLIQKNENEQLMDIQDWLNSGVIIDRNETESTYGWKDILFDSANTISTTHFDDDIPIILQRLKGIFSNNGSLVLSHILAITVVTIQLGEYLIAEIQKSNDT